MSRKEKLDKKVPGKDQQSEAEEVEGEDPADDIRPPAEGQQLSPAIPTSHQVVTHHHAALVEAIDEVMPVEAVPAAHEEERHDQGGVVRRIAVAAEPLPAGRQEEETHVDVVAQPEGERHVPAVPHLPKVPAEEWFVEVLRHGDTEEAGDADGEGAVARKV